MLSTDPEIKRLWKSINYFRPDLKQFFTEEEEINEANKG